LKTILCYGDSNTYGTIPMNVDILSTAIAPSSCRYPEEKRWTGIMKKELGVEYKIIEEGLPGRTTVFDDPVEGIHKNGLAYLVPCLESHLPIDMAIIMLGTNDLKKRFSATAFDIAWGMGALISTIQKSNCSPDGGKPEILVLCPPPLGKLSHIEDLFDQGSYERSKNLALNYKKIAGLYKCHFFDTGKIIKPSNIDGVHYDAKELEILGKEVAGIVKGIL